MSAKGGKQNVGFRNLEDQSSRVALASYTDHADKLVEACGNDFCTFGPSNYIDCDDGSRKTVAHVERDQFPASVTSNDEETIEVRSIVIS